MKRLTIVALVAYLTLAGCTGISRDAYYRLANDDDEALAQGFMRAMAAGDLDGARAMLAPGLDQASEDAWNQMRETMESADVSSAYLVGVHTNYSTDGRAATLVYEGPRDGGHFIAEMSLRDGMVYDATFWRNEQTSAEANRFIGQPISLGRAFVVLLGLGSFLYSLLTFRAVLLSDVSARRRWALVSLVGIIAVSVNWTTGQVSVETLTIRLPVFLVGAAGPDAPWILSAILPIGALAAETRLRRHRLAKSSEADGASEPDSPNQVAL